MSCPWPGFSYAELLECGMSSTHVPGVKPLSLMCIQAQLEGSHWSGSPLYDGPRDNVSVLVAGRVTVVVAAAPRPALFSATTVIVYVDPAVSPVIVRVREPGAVVAEPPAPDDGFQ